MIERILSGGQTGVDRAALDFAIERGIPHGGWCPKGRKAEDGPIPAQYRLTEMPTEDYGARTRKNVEAADGTLIIKRGELKGGTGYTAEIAQELGKPLYLLDADEPLNRASFEAWVQTHRIKVLNVAGPRESQCPGIYQKVKEVLQSQAIFAAAPKAQ